MLSTNGISVVLGVLNEAENINDLLIEFDRVIAENRLFSINELVFVDDGSTDGTREILKSSIDQGHSFRIKLLERNKKVGIVDASIAGCKIASNKTVVIMDADLQHPPEFTIKMIEKSKGKADLIIASRYVEGGRNSWSPIRGVISRGAVFLSHLFIPTTRDVRDPISGFFMTNAEYIARLKPVLNSHKILLYTMASNPNLRVEELPFKMVGRKKGSSKIVGKNFSFIVRYMREILLYWKVSATIYIEGRKKKLIELKLDTNRS